MKILAIDPSINYVGWAYYDTELDEWEGGSIFLKVGNLHTRSVEICHQLNRFKPTQFVYEKPTFMASTKGRVAAQKGYTIDLAFICGYVAARSMVNPFDIFGYTPVQWKGNVPKRATEAKYFRHFTRRTPPPSEHEIDATMLLWEHLYNPKLRKFRI